MHHAKHGAFNGAEVGQSIINDLRLRLGVDRMMKWAYMIADRAVVNHGARHEAENESSKVNF